MLHINDILRRPKYRGMGLEELELIVGNDLDFQNFMKLKGETTKEKAKILFDSFRKNDEVKPFFVEGGVTKPVRIGEACINDEKLIITIPLYYLRPKHRDLLKRGIHSIYDISYAYSLSSNYKIGLSDYIKDGYSVIIEFKERKHILIYNG